MNTYKAKHVKQTTNRTSVRRRKKANAIAVHLSNVSITLMAVWLMMVASIVGLMNTTLVPKDIFDPLKIGSKYHTPTAVVARSATTPFIATNISTTTTPVLEEKLILPNSEDAELEYESELVAELIASSEEAQQQVDVQVVEEVTTQPIEEAPAASVEEVKENIEEENHAQWWTEEDYQYLLMIIVGEAQNCSRQEQMYVGSVVLNRMNSSWFPKQNTIKQVATAKGQYACMKDGNAYKTPTETNKEVALELLTNGSVLPENVVFQALFKQGNGVYCKIGKTYFCYK